MAKTGMQNSSLKDAGLGVCQPMNKTGLILLGLVLGAFTATYVRANEGVSEACMYKGIPLRGKVQVVKNFPDFKVQKVASFPDLKVQWVKTFPDDCGKWQQVETFPDFKIQYVENFPDLKIQQVTSFPGRP